MFSLVRFLINGGLDPRFFIVIAGAGSVLGVVSFLSNTAERGTYHSLSAVATFIEKTITVVLLAIFYYLILFPLSLIFKITGHKALSKGFDQNAESYWDDVESTQKPESYFRQF